MNSKNKLIEKYKEYIKINSNTFESKYEREYATGPNVRILSFNVQLFKDINKKSSFEKLDKLIAESDADIIVLFEAVFFKNDKLLFEKIATNNKYLYTKYSNDKYGINILLSKHQIKQCSILKLIKDPIKNMNRYAILSTISINNKEIKLAACHLDVFDETEQTRLEQIKQIIDEIDNEYILLGDMNSLRKKDYDSNEWNYLINDCQSRNTDAHTLVTDFIESNNFIDCWNMINKASPKISVWSMRRVDYIYVGKSFMYPIRNCNTLVTDISDHFPLYVDLEI
jgi:endonuclease/exonuclease/phosphatase family metal-dependent hydrolase